ncbi:DUF1211 domain-containing protein [Edaphobacter sp. HDX4]
MVLDLKVPHGSRIGDLAPLLPVCLSYVVSFLYIGIYWNNHHHLLQTCKDVTASILGADLHLLFGFLYSRLLRDGWRKPLRIGPHRALRLCAPDGWGCLLLPSTRHYAGTG